MSFSDYKFQNPLQTSLNSITFGIIFSHPPDALKQKINEDSEFRQSFYQAILEPPTIEIHAIASKIIQILPLQAIPQWAKSISSQLLNQPRDEEQHFLRSCASGKTIDFSMIKSKKIDPTKTRDLEGRTGLHLALMNPSLEKEDIGMLVAACPNLCYQRDYDQNLPGDLEPSVSFNPNIYFCELLFVGPNPLNLKPVLIYLMHLKDPQKAIECLKKCLEWCQTESIQDLDCLQDLLVHWKSNQRLELLSLIAKELQLPFLVLVAMIAPQQIAEALNGHYSIYTNEGFYVANKEIPEFYNRPLTKSLETFPLLQSCGKFKINYRYFIENSEGEPYYFVRNMRAILMTQPSLLKEFINISIKSQNKIEILACEIIGSLLAALPEENPEAYQQASQQIDELLKDVEEDSQATLYMVAVPWIFKLGSAGAKLFSQILLKHFVTYADFKKAKNNSPHDIFESFIHLDHPTLKLLIQRFTETEPSPKQETPFMMIILESWSKAHPSEVMTSTECLDILSLMAKEEHYDYGGIVPKAEVLDRIGLRLDCDELFSFLIYPHTINFLKNSTVKEKMFLLFTKKREFKEFSEIFDTLIQKLELDSSVPFMNENNRTYQIVPCPKTKTVKVTCKP